MRSKNPAEVSGAEIFKAMMVWTKFWQNKKMVPERDFANFLGMSRLDIPMQYNTIRLVRQSAAKKIKLLNSPHYHAILMAYKIRKRK